MNQERTLTEEVMHFGTIQMDGCYLSVEHDKGVFLMRDSDAIRGGLRHTLDISTTDDERLEAHWAGFRKNVHERHVARAEGKEWGPGEPVPFMFNIRWENLSEHQQAQRDILAG